MDPSSTVDSVRDSLVLISEKGFKWLTYSTALVGAGCVLEIGETWTLLTRWVRLKRGRPVEDENPTSWHIPAGAIGLLFVIIGVSGEGYFEVKVSNADTALRAHDEAVLADTIKEAGTAKDSANDAVKAAELAKRSAGEAIVKADTASAAANKAGASAAGALIFAGNAKTEIATTEAEVKTTEANVQRVDEKFAFRTLSRIKRDILVEFLKKAPIKPKEPIQVEAFLSAVDGITYGGQISDAINDPATGWQAGQVSALLVSGTSKSLLK